MQALAVLCVLKEQGRLDEALAGYQIAIWLDPQAPSAHLAQSVIERTTECSDLKRQINELLGAPVLEQKQYG